MLTAVISDAYGVLDNTEGETVITADGTLTINADSDMSFRGDTRDTSAGVAMGNRGGLNLGKNGTGNMVLGVLQLAFSGTTVLDSGPLYLGCAGTASTGNVTFGAAVNATLNGGERTATPRACTLPTSQSPTPLRGPPPATTCSP
jgi:di/tripeptidase